MVPVDGLVPNRHTIIAVEHRMQFRLQVETQMYGFPISPQKTALQPLESIFNYCSSVSLKYNNMAFHHAYVYRWKCEYEGIDFCSKHSMWDSQRIPLWTDWPQGSKELTTETQLQDAIDSGSLVTTLETACRGKSPAGKIVKGQWCTASSECWGLRCCWSS